MFAGAGGMDLGFQKADHKVVWANDSDDDAVATYRLNLGDHIVGGDIRKIRIASLPKADVVAAGFPCQGFSRANIHRADNDDRNNLYVHVVKFLRHIKPKFFLLENVRGILSLNKGADFSEIYAALEESHYRVDFRVLNAADFGVPQHRLRVIICGVRRDLENSLSFVFPEPTHSKNRSTGRKWLAAGEALKKIPEPDCPHRLLNHIGSQYKVVNRDFTGHRRMNPHQPSPTILARGNGGGGVCALPHPANHRRLTVRESAILQSFPMQFTFTGKLMSMYRQIGNAVPPLLAQHLAHGFRERY